MKKVFFIFAILLVFADISSAQDWVQTNGPGGGVTSMIATPKGSIIARIGSSLWRLDSVGSGWQPSADVENLYLEKLAVDSNKNILLIINTDTYQSTDEGKSWVKISSRNYVVHGNNTCVVILPNGAIFIGSDYSGFYRSTDNGLNWSWNYLNKSSEGANSLATSRDGILYAATEHKDSLYRSLDNGDTWEAFYIRGESVNYLFTDIYGNVFAFANWQKRSMLRSSDQGETWTLWNEGFSGNIVTSITEAPNGTIIAATDSGVFALDLEACVWHSLSKNLPTHNIFSVACNFRGELFAGTDGHGAFKNTETFGGPSKLAGILKANNLNYDTIAIGKTICKDLTIINTGFAPFVLKSFTVADSIPFSVSDESAKKLPITLLPKDSIVMNICFHPPQPAAYKSSIIWNTDIDPALCGISRETVLHGIAIEKSSVQNSSLSKNNFSVHPNPVSGNSLKVSFDEALPHSSVLSVFDVLGREVYHNNLAAGQKEFDLPIRELSEGMYYIRIETDGVVETKQFIKLK